MEFGRYPPGWGEEILQTAAVANLLIGKLLNEVRMSRAGGAICKKSSKSVHGGPPESIAGSTARGGATPIPNPFPRCAEFLAL